MGKLYTFKVTPDLCVYILPVEMATRNGFEGFVVSYILNPTRSPEDLYCKATKEDLIIPPVVLANFSFRDGTFSYIENPLFIQIPFFENNIFYNRHMDLYLDMHGNHYDGPNECPAADVLHSLASLCQEITCALGITADCLKLHVAGPDLVLSYEDAARPDAGFSNSRSLGLEVVIPGDAGATVDPELTMDVIEDALDRQLKAAQAGKVTGNAADEEGDIVELRIKPRRFPDALPAIAAALAEAGVLRYNVRVWK